MDKSEESETSGTEGGEQKEVLVNTEDFLGEDRDAPGSNADQSSEVVPSEEASEEVQAVKRLETELAAVKEEAAANYDKYVRAVAEFENYKKRAIRERADLIQYAGEHLARDLLEVIDHLELAVAKEMPGVNEELVKGVKMVLEQFSSVLARHSIRSETSVGGQFDPSKQEALSTLPTEEHEVGTVLEEWRKAYFFKDRLLRAAQVIVAVKPESAQPRDEPPAEPTEPEQSQVDMEVGEADDKR